MTCSADTNTELTIKTFFFILALHALRNKYKTVQNKRDTIIGVYVTDDKFYIQVALSQTIGYLCIQQPLRKTFWHPKIWAFKKKDTKWFQLTNCCR